MKEWEQRREVEKHLNESPRCPNLILQSRIGNYNLIFFILKVPKVERWKRPLKRSPSGNKWADVFEQFGNYQDSIHRDPCLILYTM